jgi:hypothetical protein
MRRPFYLRSRSSISEGGSGRVVAQRAAFEHLIAEQSARLINCPPAETKARLEQALAEFGRTIDADRVYVVLGENPSLVYAWS